MDYESNIQIAANIVLKKTFLEDPNKYKDLNSLPTYYKDSRLSMFRSAEQNQQIIQQMFYAKKRITEEEQEQQP